MKSFRVFIANHLVGSGEGASEVSDGSGSILFFGLLVWRRAMLSFCMTWEGFVSFVIHDVCNRPSAFASDLRDEPIQVLSRWLGLAISTYRSECQVVTTSLSY